MGDRLDAAVISAENGRLVLPQHIVSMVALDDEDEAHYVAAAINSVVFQFASRAYSQAGGKSFGTPQILENIRIPKYDSGNALHVKLAQLSKDAHHATAAGDSARLQACEGELSRLAASLWGITRNELKDIELSLDEILWRPTRDDATNVA